MNEDEWGILTEKSILVEPSNRNRFQWSREISCIEYMGGIIRKLILKVWKIYFSGEKKICIKYIGKIICKLILNIKSLETGNSKDKDNIFFCNVA